jgi:hypothetical protein
MPPERRTVSELDAELGRVREWQTGHERQCAERYQGLRDDMKEVRETLSRMADRIFAHPVAPSPVQPEPRPQTLGDRVKLWGVIVALFGGLAGAVDVLSKIAVGLQALLNPPPHA